MVYKEFPGYRIVLLGDKNTKDRALRLQSSLKREVINMCGKTTLRELIAVLKGLDVFITPDTATLHLAQSLGISTIALFGPTNPSAHTIKSPNLRIIVKKLTCSFCYKSACKTYECMLNISPLEVAAQLKKILSLN